jgi:NADH:ubiquinone oxidoreductase subunit H
VITWPFQIFLSLCDIIAGWFVDRGSINFLLFRMAVAIMLITISVMLAVYGRRAVALFGQGVSESQ